MCTYGQGGTGHENEIFFVCAKKELVRKMNFFLCVLKKKKERIPLWLKRGNLKYYSYHVNPRTKMFAHGETFSASV